MPTLTNAIEELRGAFETPVLGKEAGLGAAVGSKNPAVPEIDVQEARILIRNSSLLKHLRTHPAGDLLSAKGERAADSIKTAVREWLLTTPAGKRALAAADIAEGELSIDRVLARHDKQQQGMRLNCVYNLYLMPVQHNSYFGDQCSAEKRAYIGERAYLLARAAYDDKDAVVGRSVRIPDAKSGE